jgi:archaellum component FlaC
MTEINVDIMVEVLTVVGTAIKVKRERRSELISHWFFTLLIKFYQETYLKKLTGNLDIEESLQRSDNLTHEEVKVASAEILRITHSVEEKMMSVDNRVQGVDDKIQGIGDKIQGIDDEVKGVGDKVQSVDGKLEYQSHVISSLLLFLSKAQTFSQGTCSAIICFAGYRPQIHPPITTL